MFGRNRLLVNVGCVIGFWNGFDLNLANTIAAEPDKIATSAESWPGWRGPNRDATTAPIPWPQSLQPEHFQKQWSVPLDRSYSGPIIVDQKVIVTETKDSKMERVIALDRETGKSVWTSEWEGSMKVPFFAASNGSWIRSTPITDGSKVYIGGMRDFFVCLDARSGEKIFNIDFTKRFGTELPGFGQVCSPLLDEDRIYIQSGGGLLCLNATSGETIWRSLVDSDAMYGSAFSSPIIATIQGVRQLVVQTRKALCGIEMEMGKTLWSQNVEAFRGMNILTPTIWNECLFVSSYGGKTQLFAPTRNSDGAWAVSEKWSNKAEAYMSSPVVIGDYLYVHLKNQRAACFNLKTGEETWRTRPYGKYWSMITNGKQILALDETGKLFLINANPEKFDLVDTKEVSEQECWAHIAMAGNQVFIRDLAGISLWSW
jgi:outer membrane protein assembly factor BamB